MLGYHVPAPNEALLISGRKQKAADSQFKIVTGHGAFVVPIISRSSTLTLAMQEAEVEEDCYTQQGLTLGVKAVIAFKVGDDHESIAAAARRFQSDQSQMSTLVGRIFSGHLRSIIGSMTVESIIRDQQKLSDNILDASKIEMARIGLAVDSLQISQIDDKGSGYIAALAAPHQAMVNQIAKIAQAQADQAAADAQQQSGRAQLDYARETAVKRSEYQALMDRAEEKSAQAGPLAAAQAQQAVLEEQKLVAEKNAELRKAELIAEIVAPAEAEAARILTLARAQAAATKLSAVAAAAEGRIALDQRILDQLPDLVTAAAAGLQSSQLTVFNGAAGVNEMMSQLVAQGASIFDTVRGTFNTIDSPVEEEADPEAVDAEYELGDEEAETPADEAEA
jgi:flotillin